MTCSAKKTCEEFGMKCSSEMKSAPLLNMPYAGMHSKISDSGYSENKDSLSTKDTV